MSKDKPDPPTEILLNFISMVAMYLRRRIATVELFKSEEKHRKIISTTSEGYFLVNEKGNFIDVNEAYSRIIGYSREELLEMSISDVEALENKIETELHIRHIIKLGHDSFETIQKRKNGNDICLLIHASHIQTTESQVIVFCNDLTESKIKEEELNKNISELATTNKELEKFAHANAELEQFAYIASHNLQQPLRTISNYMQIFDEDYSEVFDDNARKYVHVVNDASKRMILLLNSLLDFSRLGRNLKLTKVVCKKVIDDVIADLETMITTSNATIKVSGIAELNVYESEFSQLFQNLIVNAIKFTKNDNPPKIKISSEKINGMWKFSVSDNGIGIASKNFEKIFDIFQRLHNESEYQGNGIGLAFCKKIVQLHKGEIWVESIIGQGTTFYFTIANLTE